MKRLLLVAAIGVVSFHAIADQEHGVVTIDNLPVYVLGTLPSEVTCMNPEHKVIYQGKTEGDYGYVVDRGGNQGDTYDDVVFYDVNLHQAKRVSGNDLNCFFIDSKGNT